MVQLIQGRINLVEGCPLATGVRKNRLNRVDLGFVFLEASHNRFQSKRIHDSLTSIDCRIGYVRKGGHSHYLKSRELCFDSLDSVSERR